MKKIPLIFILLSFSTIACGKEQKEQLFTVEVFDYNTGKPIENAFVGQSIGNSYFNTLCWCWIAAEPKLIGVTNSNGILTGLKSLEGIRIETYDYIRGIEATNCVSEKENNILRFYLFLFSQVNIIVNSAKQYTEPPYVETNTLLKDGTILTFDSYLKYYLTGKLGWSHQLLTAKNRKNNILVLKKNTATNKVDTLFNKEIFVDPNTITDVLIDY